jgi:hypothetical protein
MGGPYFDCFLADQPSYLVPSRLLAENFYNNPPGRLTVNSNVWFSWRDKLPDAIGGYMPLPEKFLGRSGFIWVCDPEAKTQLPFWAGPWFQNQISGLWPGQIEPSNLIQRFRSILLCAGVLKNSDGNDSLRERAEELTRASVVFREYGYAPVRHLIHPFHLGSLRRYYRYLLRTGGMRLGDSATPLRYVAHNESVARFFHRQLTGVVSQVAGVAVKPSYVYVSTYRSGAELPIHTDREQCEYSVTLLLDHTPEPMDQSPWPLFLETNKGPVEIWQGLGDSLLYRGRQIPHYRKSLPEGMTSTSIFFHYVDWEFDGPLD